METLKNNLKFWRSSTLLVPTTTTYSAAAKVETEAEEDYEPVNEAVVEEEEDDQEEESFFELEVVMLNCCQSQTGTKTTTVDESLRLNAKEGCLGRRVVPIEAGNRLKPQPLSPVSILKSAPNKFKVSLFRKPKTEQPEARAVPFRPKTDPHLKPSKVDDIDEEKSAKISTLIRETSSKKSPPKVRKQNDNNSNNTADEDEDLSSMDSSKRFSKDVMHKYLKLKLIKPFHLRVAAKRCSSGNKSRLFDLMAVESPVSSPAPSATENKLKHGASANGFRVVCKQLGKSRSASSMVVRSPMVSRRDCSLLEHDDDGIQSAILHCKRSFNCSSESSVLSRSSSDSTRKSTDQERPSPRSIMRHLLQ